MKKVALGLLVALVGASSALASDVVLGEADHNAREAFNYDGGIYGTSADGGLVPVPKTVEKNELPAITSTDVTAFNVAGISLGMELDVAMKAAQKHAQQRNIPGVRTQNRNGKVASLAWGNANEETLVFLIDRPVSAPDKSLVKSVRYSFNNPEALVAGALEKYGEPSIKDAGKGKYTWCSAERDIKSQCNMQMPWITIDTRSVPGIGILDMTDPTLVKSSATERFEAPVTKDNPAKQDYEGPKPGL